MAVTVAQTRLRTMVSGTGTERDDLLVIEEPLEIRLGHGPLTQREEFRMSVTMRTPGHDTDLVLGFLFTEGLVSALGQLVRVEHCRQVKEEEQGNVVRAELAPEVPLDPAQWQRHFYTTSSCGVCGKSSLEAVHVRRTRPVAPFHPVAPEVIVALPERMRKAQTVFRHTGGIHAAALFDLNGDLLILREDVGRHNAVDKVIGAALLAGADLHACILLVSGRAGFELVQKSVVAGIPVMAAVGAPSSLAVRLAQESGLTLIGFLRDDRFNMYTY